MSSLPAMGKLSPFKSIRLLAGATGSYSARLAASAGEVQLAQALRFLVFNLELQEGLEASFEQKLDIDPFDPVCDHLLVEHLPTREIVGTYRLQTGAAAARNRGYYSEQEFDLSRFETHRQSLVELGRACVHQAHRNLVVLGLLWKGIADYAKAHSARYLFGCSSLTSQDTAVGLRAFQDLSKDSLTAETWRALPRPGFECIAAEPTRERVKIPKLLSAYLAIGAKICGPPAIDRAFKTIDFLTLLDTETIPAAVYKRLLT